MRSSSVSAAAILALALTGCGAAPSPTPAAPEAELRPEAVLLEIGRASSVRNLFDAPEQDTETIAALLADASDGDREELAWNLVRARLALIEEAHASRPGLESAVADAIQERARAVGSLRERRANEEQLARNEAEATERDRQATERDRQAAERDRQAAEARRLTEREAEASQRQDTAAERGTGDQPDTAMDARERARARRDEDFRRRAAARSGTPRQPAEEVQRDPPSERDPPSGDERERERQRLDSEFQRRAAAAEERRRRREGSRDNKGAQDLDASEKQSRRTRRRRRQRRQRDAARRARRSQSARASGDERRHEEDGQSTEPEITINPDEESLDDAQRAELEVHVQRERDARQQLRFAETTIGEQREELTQLASQLARGDASDQLKTGIAFALVWAAWRTGHPSAAELSERFTEEHPGAGDLLALVWMIRGEVAAAEMLADEALAAFRFGMNRLGEPIYAYSLWRSASVQRDSGDAAGARESLLGVEQEGCAREAHELVRRLAHAATSTLGHDVRADPDGVMRPESCPVPGERTESTEWRPEE